MSGSGVFDVSRLCDTVVIPARRTVGRIIDLDSNRAFRAVRASSAIGGSCASRNGWQTAGGLDRLLVLRRSDAEDSRNGAR